MYFNVGKTLNDVQVATISNLIVEEYSYFMPDDFKLCFNRAKKGKYGKVYDRIDGQVIFDWLNAYSKERIAHFDEKNMCEHNNRKNGKGEVEISSSSITYFEYLELKNEENDRKQRQIKSGD